MTNSFAVLETYFPAASQQPSPLRAQIFARVLDDEMTTRVHRWRFVKDSVHLTVRIRANGRLDFIQTDRRCGLCGAWKRERNVLALGLGLEKPIMVCRVRKMKAT